MAHILNNVFSKFTCSKCYKVSIFRNEDATLKAICCDKENEVLHNQGVIKKPIAAPTTKPSTPAPK